MTDESDAERRLREMFGSDSRQSDRAATGGQTGAGWEPGRRTAGTNHTGAVLMVCVNHRRDSRQPSCGARGSNSLADSLEALAADRGLADRVQRIHCLGQCQLGPTARVAPGGRFFRRVTEADLPGLLDELARVHANRNTDPEPSGD